MLRQANGTANGNPEGKRPGCGRLRRTGRGVPVSPDHGGREPIREVHADPPTVEALWRRHGARGASMHLALGLIRDPNWILVCHPPGCWTIT